MRRISAGLFALVVLLMAAACSSKTTPVNQVELPERVEYVGSWEEAQKNGEGAKQEAWVRARNSRKAAFPVKADRLEELYRSLFGGEFTEAGEENLLLSPMSVYFTLSALAEMTEGAPQEKIIRLCGCESAEELQEQTRTIWNRIYEPAGTGICIPATSVWCDRILNYKQDAVEDLTQYDYAEVFQGQLSSPEMQKAASRWVSDRSNGMLKEERILGEDAALEVLSVLYYEDRWSLPFEEKNNIQDVFYGTSGEERAEYMREERMSSQYFRGNGYILVRKTMTDGYMWFALPDEEEDTGAVFRDENLISVLCSEAVFEQKAESGIVNLTMPKFDIKASVCLNDAMKAMGLNDLFTPEGNAFSRFTDQTVFLTEVSSHARLTVNEQGVKAAALTAGEFATGDPSGIIVEVVLNRPFIFAITGKTGLIYYAGTVSHINEAE